MEIEVEILKSRIDQVADLIATLSASARQTSLVALDLQALALTKKHQIEKAIDNVNDLEGIIGQLIEFLEKLICFYIVRNDDYPC